MHLRLFSIVATFSALAVAYPCPAQLVSVQCCSIEEDFEGITECVSGANVLVRPAGCAPAATCILGFGADMSFMEELCGPAQETPIFIRGFCSSWFDASTPVVHQCVALANPSVTMFEVFDDEQDGDLDAADMEAFNQIYAGVPKLIQSEAKMVFAECCIPEASEIGECLSGPGVSNQPATCQIEPLCTAGFSAPLEPGDWLYKVCAQSPAESGPPAAYCTSWNSDEPANFECVAAHLPGHSLFELIDVDGDVDVDLADYAVLQRDIADSPP